jgi:integrase
VISRFLVFLAARAHNGRTNEIDGAMQKATNKRAEMRKAVTKRAVDALKPGEHIADDEVIGFVARCLPSGTVSYGFRFRSGAKRRWLPLGLHGNITPEQARKLAKQAAGKVAAGKDPQDEREEARAKAKAEIIGLLNNVLDDFVRHYARNLRSVDEVVRCFDVYVRPRLGEKSIYDLRRSDVMKMLDEIAAQNGEVMSDRVLAYFRKALNWQATRDDAFNPPIVKGMARTKPRERSRDRTLNDEEIRDLWKALDEMAAPEPYPCFIKVLFLTAQRLREVSNMRWEEVGEAIWTIPAEKYKTNLYNAVPLTEEVRALLGKAKKYGYCFSTDGGKTAFSGFSKAKRALDKKIAEVRKKDGRKPMPHWTPHDLRRSARSLMSRAGVPSDIAERVLGHVIPGVRGVYDRHAYIAEKREALEKLAGLVNTILHPGTNVVQFPSATA